MTLPWFSPFSGPGDKWLTAALLSIIRVHGHLIEQALRTLTVQQVDLNQALLCPSISEASAVVRLAFPSEARLVDGKPVDECCDQVAQAVRLAYEAGIVPEALRLLLSMVGRTETDFWSLLVRVGPSLTDVQGWARDGWPDEQSLEVLAALRTQPA